MSKKEKKDFLTGDLIERMIRVEQRVSASMGKPIHFKNTEYYKSLRPHEKEKFEKHLKTNGVKMYLFSVLALGGLVYFSTFTGNVVSSNSSVPIYSKAALIFLNVLLVCFLLVLIYERRFRKKRLDKIGKLAEKVVKTKKK